MQLNPMKFKMKPLLYALFFLLLTQQASWAQFDSNYLQYRYNPGYFNPAHAGNSGNLEVLAMYQQQWEQLEGAPETLNFSLNSPIRLRNVSLGVGFTSNRIGATTESVISTDISYRIQLDAFTQLSFGIKAGLSMVQVDFERLGIYNPNDPSLKADNHTAPIFGTGVYLTKEQWYLGLSSPNFLKTAEFDEFKVSQLWEETRLYLLGGYIFHLNPNLDLEPSFLLTAATGAPLGIDISANAHYKEQLSLGVGYAWNTSLNFMAGFQVFDRLMIGYSYAYDISDFGAYHSNIHEVFLKFSLPSQYGLGL